MKNHKKLFSLLLVLCVMLCIGIAAYAAVGGFTMTYLPGTSDTVTNMPAADSGVGGQAYTVSDKIPQREGYEFLGWTLDYGIVNTYTLTYQVTGDPTYGIPGDTATPDPVTGIRAGSNVTLTNALSTAWVTGDGSPVPTKESYKVNYLEKGFDRELSPQKLVVDLEIGSTVTEIAPYLDDYRVVGADTQDLTIKLSKIGKWTFTGWCSDEACTTPITEVTNISADTTVYGKWLYSETTNVNEITFYYEVPPVQYVSYTVRYIDVENNYPIYDDKNVKNVPNGDLITEYPVSIAGYTPLTDPITWRVSDGDIQIFMYYYSGQHEDQ